MSILGIGPSVDRLGGGGKGCAEVDRRQALSR